MRHLTIITTAILAAALLLSGCGEGRAIPDAVPPLSDGDASCCHEWDAQVLAEQGCIAQGVALRRCTKCGAEEVDISEPLGHQWKTEATVEGTCLWPSMLTESCVRCGDSHTEQGGMGGHEWQDVLYLDEETGDAVSRMNCALCGVWKDMKEGGAAHEEEQAP